MQIRALALQPPFLLTAAAAAAAVAWLVGVVAPREGGANLLVYVAICSLIGGFTVISCKALGIALKLTASGRNQLAFLDTYVVAGVRSCTLPHAPARSCTHVPARPPPRCGPPRAAAPTPAVARGPLSRSRLTPTSIGGLQAGMVDVLGQD